MPIKYNHYVRLWRDGNGTKQNKTRLLPSTDSWCDGGDSEEITNIYFTNRVWEAGTECFGEHKETHQLSLIEEEEQKTYVSRWHLNPVLNTESAVDGMVGSEGEGCILGMAELKTTSYRPWPSHVTIYMYFPYCNVPTPVLDQDCPIRKCSPLWFVMRKTKAM